MILVLAVLTLVVVVLTPTRLASPRRNLPIETSRFTSLEIVKPPNLSPVGPLFHRHPCRLHLGDASNKLNRPLRQPGKNTESLIPRIDENAPCSAAAKTVSKPDQREPVHHVSLPVCGL